MEVRLIEATQHLDHGFNWGKFAVMRFTDVEWERRSSIATTSARPLLAHTQWDSRSIFVLDLQTGEGARFYPPGSARADLAKHRIWVCPMYEPFLAWLYGQFLADLSKLPDVVELPGAESAMFGHRRPGT